MKAILTTFIGLLPLLAAAQELYDIPAGADTRWISLENRSGAKGRGAMENGGAKGDASQWVKAGKSIELLHIDGGGVINRIWMTMIDRSPAALRSMHIDMYWEGSAKPAVSVPLGDFFGIGLGRTAAFQSALFADPEGKSFICYIPMPFRKQARIVLVNESGQDELLFYDIDLTRLKKLPRKMAYFHACWNNNEGAQLGSDFDILPEVKGSGRFLGTNVSVITDQVYGSTWFGEGEVKVYLDGDKEFPTLAGTGTEDYLGSAWNLGAFTQLYQGAPIVDKGKGQFAFYRYHIPDPVYFHSGCRVTMAQMGGGGRDQIRAIAKAGGRVKPVSVMTRDGMIKLLEDTTYPGLSDDRFSKEDWVNFYRVDHYSATAYYYLDRPDTGLPPLAPLAERLKGIQ